MKPRVFLAGLFHETNTFVDEPTQIDSFQITRGRDILGFLGNDSPMDGFLQSARDYDWEVIPGVDYRANPSGLVDDDIFERFWVELLEYLEPALSRGIVAIFLVLAAQFLFCKS